MKTVLIYSSVHGRTRKVVDRVLSDLRVEPCVMNVKDLSVEDLFKESDLILVFAPTYGDEELDEDMESFLLSLKQDLSRKKFSICELGNYYGYDDFSFGAMRIIRKRLLELNASEICEPLSLDSMPKVNWDHLKEWVNYLNSKISDNE